MTNGKGVLRVLTNEKGALYLDISQGLPDLGAQHLDVDQGGEGGVGVRQP